MRKVLIFATLACCLLGSVFAATGTVHLVFANGNTVVENDTAYFEFDVQAWLSEGEEVLGAGMVYVEYPEALFGDVVVYNDKVTVEKAGILAAYDNDLTIELYDIINTNDTRVNCFAVTFEAVYIGSSESYKNLYDFISTDSLNPSGLLKVRLQAAAEGSGTVFFPGDIPGTDQLYYNYENENFTGGLDISDATEAFEISYNVTPPDPEEYVYVELKKFAADWKKEEMVIEWFTKDETGILGYILKRSENGGAYVVAADYQSNPALAADPAAPGAVKYAYTDPDAVPGNSYTYRLEYADVNGNIGVLYPPEGTSSEDILVEDSYPNPFNPQFTVPFTLSAAQDIDMKLYDMSGKVVRNVAGGRYSAGNYKLQVNCSDLASGMYILRANIGGRISTQKMMLLK
jgi:hypothetical protein